MEDFTVFIKVLFAIENSKQNQKQLRSYSNRKHKLIIAWLYGEIIYTHAYTPASGMHMVHSNMFGAETQGPQVNLQN